MVGGGVGVGEALVVVRGVLCVCPVTAWSGSRHWCCLSSSERQRWTDVSIFLCLLPPPSPNPHTHIPPPPPRAHTHARPHTYTHTHVRTQTRAHTYTHTHTHTPLSCVLSIRAQVHSTHPTVPYGTTAPSLSVHDVHNGREEPALNLLRPALNLFPRTGRRPELHTLGTGLPSYRHLAPNRRTGPERKKRRLFLPIIAPCSIA